MKLLDLFCGAGGAAMGYHRAGFEEIVGVDISPMPRYPFMFVQADALDYVTAHGHEFDAIHASPPCQRYCTMSRQRPNHLDLYVPTRQRLDSIGTPYVIENVVGAPYLSGIILCGSMFGLAVRRHRNFETNWKLQRGLSCDHKKQGRPITVTGSGGGQPRPHSWKGVRREWPMIMGMPWALPAEVTQAIPPAYTEFVGQALLRAIKRKFQ